LGTADKARFAHRLTETGRYESICLQCFRTIGGASAEPGLKSLEGGHVCAEEDLIQLHARIGPEPVRYEDRKKDSA
jgi:hypothetical protein